MGIKKEGNSALLRNTLTTIPSVAAGVLAATLVGEGVSAASGAIGDTIKRKRAWDGMMVKSPGLRSRSEKKVREIFDTLWRFAPSLAQDPPTAAKFVEQMIDMPDGVTYRTVMDLVSAQATKDKAEMGKMGPQLTRSVSQAYANEAIRQTMNPGASALDAASRRVGVASGLEGMGMTAEEAYAAAMAPDLPSKPSFPGQDMSKIVSPISGPGTGGRQRGKGNK